MNFDPKEIKAGDWLVPFPFWNKTAGRGNALPVPVLVDGARKEFCQTGISFAVTSTTGRIMWLDAAWFAAKVPAPEDSQ